ncbi:glycosyltransferase family 2 protein [Psychrobacter sp. APC 3350]|uniref:glycosyltransferase family 2 protein n=2 Tax=unclassified Psychrobacter TaxID=196806 RepID=UPI0025B3F880|nr:glycosyltransferase family 2 protein [Psychrobacter sp. APC 3350]MDN3454335.1 glycosyltransferase family 2 protein [Psychrobacter sp. APC 3350]
MKTNEGLLSICCLGYNHADFLRENLDSIKRIDYPHIEVIVVDDGSSDNSVTLLKKIKKEFPFELKIITQENTGNIGKNLNIACNFAKGGLITFISLDDIFNSKSILEEIKIMNTNPKLAFVAAKKVVTINDSSFINNVLPKLPIDTTEKPSLEELLDFEYTKFGAFYIQGVIFRKKVIDKIQCFDEDMTGDDIVLRTKLFKEMIYSGIWDYHLINSNNVFYRLHDNNIHKNSIRQIKIVTEYLDKYWPESDDPEILIDWVCNVICNKSSGDFLPMFSLNNRVSRLLKNERVQNSIKESILSERPNIFNLILSKKKIDKVNRQIVIFNYIKIDYKKKSKTKVNNNCHFLDYSN